MEPGTTTQPPPPYFLPGQTQADPNLPPNQQQPDSIVIVQDPNNQP